MSSDLKVTNIKHADSASNNLVLASDGTTTVSGALTASGGIKVADGGTIGSASDADAITIDSSGNVLVGTTDSAGTRLSATSGGGTVLQGTSYSVFSRELSSSAQAVMTVNNTGVDGKCVEFYKDGSLSSIIGHRNSTNLYIAFRAEANGDGCGLSGSSSSDGAVIPTDGDGNAVDNHIDFGTSGSRWDDIHATNGSIQTSDKREKQDIEELSEAEQRVAVVAKGLLRKYRWKSAVEKKGDDARIHFGIIAQDLKSAFEAEGLDAGRYGMFIHSEWWETKETYTNDDGAEKTRINTYDTEEEAPEGAVKKDRMGVRYSELLAFIISAI